MKTLTDLKHKMVCLIGLGVTGQSVVRFLHDKVQSLVVMDDRDVNLFHRESFESVKYKLGGIDYDEIAQADLLVLSPGIPLDSKTVLFAKERRIPIIGDLTLYSAFNKTKTIAITGSNGKSTVTELVTDMLSKDGLKAKAGGNIGFPALDLLSHKLDVHVLELSSFQLDLCCQVPSDVSTVLNISPDHMDRYDTFEAYRQSKLSIYNCSNRQVINADEQAAKPINVAADALYFSLNKTDNGMGFDSIRQMITLNGTDLVDFSQCKLIGRHNISNIQVAAALALAVGCSKHAIVQSALSFSGLSHRCQTVGTFHDVTWINDSKATNVAAALAAITGICPSVKGKLYWLAGGVSKDADFSVLTSTIGEKVEKTFAFGQDAKAIARHCPNTEVTHTLHQAMNAAKAAAQAGDVILLSPACASFDGFKNYQERGERFCHYVEELHSAKGNKKNKRNKEAKGMHSDCH